MNAPGDGRFEDLWTDFLEGELSEDHVEQLDRLLADDDTLRQRAASLYEEHRLLGLLHQPFDVETFVAESRRRIATDGDGFVRRVTGSLGPPLEEGRGRSSRRWVGYVVVSVTAVVLTLAIDWLTESVPSGGVESRIGERGLEDEETPRIAEPTAVATLDRCNDCKWRDATEQREGSRLEPGRLRLDSGTAVVRFDGGALALLTGPAELVVESDDSARLIAGDVTIHAPEEAIGFTLRTPGHEIIDLGTEFHVAVGEAGETAVEVLDGEIETRPRNGGEQRGRILERGRAVRLDPDGAVRDEAFAPATPRFHTRLAEMRSNGPSGRVVASESFEYPPGQHEHLNGGSGWRTPWRERRGTELVHSEHDDTSRMNVVRAPMVFAPFLGDNADGRSVRFPAGPNYRLRELAQPIDLGRDGVHFVSFLGYRDAGRAPNSVLRLTLRSSEDYWGDTVGLGFPRARRPHAHLGTFREAVPSAARFVRDVPLLWVVKITARAEGPDELAVRIYEPDETIHLLEPSLWTIELEGADSDAKLDVLVLTANGGLAQWFDELRVGTSWEAVTSHVRDTDERAP